MHAELQNNQIFIFNCYLYKDTIKEISGCHWEPGQKAWIVPCNAESIATLQLIGCEFSDELLKMAKKLNTQKTETTAAFPIEPMPIQGTPFEHQIQAYNMACRSMNIFNGGGVI